MIGRCRSYLYFMSALIVGEPVRRGADNRCAADLLEPAPP